MLDLAGEDDWSERADRIEALGAERVSENEQDGVGWVVFRDPEASTSRIFAPRRGRSWRSARLTRRRDRGACTGPAAAAPTDNAHTIDPRARGVRTHSLRAERRVSATLELRDDAAVAGMAADQESEPAPGGTARPTPRCGTLNAEAGGSRGGCAYFRAERRARGGGAVSEVVMPGRGESMPDTSGATVEGIAPGRFGRRAPRRRPSGAPPPLPRHLRMTGAGWLIAAVVAIFVTALVFRNGVSGAAITVIDVDDSVVRWMSDIDLPGIHGVARGLSYAASWWVIEFTVWLLIVALAVFRRWRHLVIYLVVSQIVQIVHDLLYDLTTQPRPFGVPLRGSWGGWSLPSIHMLSLAGLLVIALYTLVPEGRLRNRLKWVAAVVVTLVAVARLHLGVDSVSGTVLGVLIAVGFVLTAFRYFAPSEVFPVTYRRGRTAHLDVGGARGEAIRKAVADQLGMTVSEVKPVGLSGSAGSTPLRLRVEGASSPYLFGKLYSRTHLRSDRWYKLGRELMYGRLEDEKPFNTVRRLVQQEDYALRVVREAGAPGAKSYGFVELTPEREYMLVTEFLDDAVELGDAEVDEALIDEALHLVRILWNAGLAHRDIKPANLMVRDGRILLIDVAFAELRPTPWRQAVDLANMMLCLALRSSAQQVYDRALLQFTIEEITEAFAAARGLALPSQLRRALRSEGRDVHGEFLRLLPERPRPIKVQRWTFRRLAVALATAVLVFLLVRNTAWLFGNEGNVHTPVHVDALCGGRWRRCGCRRKRCPPPSSSRASRRCPWVGRSGC